MALEFQDVRDHWETIKPGIIELRKNYAHDWRLEDVYASLLNGKSQLLMDIARTPNGFTVVQSVPIPFQNAQKMLIWLAYDPVEDSAITYADELEALARETGHKQIEFLTPHERLWELGKSFGYEFRWAVLNKNLTGDADGRRRPERS